MRTQQARCARVPSRLRRGEAKYQWRGRRRGMNQRVRLTVMMHT